MGKEYLFLERFMIIDKVHKKVLGNGLTVLALPNGQIPKVSVQVWYNVGSKDEASNQKGIAHLIEHMIFKGTKTLSESDINLIARKLSGYCNAFTSNDYTGYLFDFPTQHWLEALPIMADCMRNCTFQEAFLNSELKAVIQELKMYNDDYPSTLIEKMVGAIFDDHPYHYPIIGYKRDLWSLKREELVAFYEKHYIPNNATLVVVGDIMPDEVFKEAEGHFGVIKGNPHYKKEHFYHGLDIRATKVVLERDVQQPIIMVAWLVPGVKARHNYLLDLVSWVIGAGKGSRLYKKLVDELGVVTDIESFVYDLFEHSLFVIQFQPKDGVDTEHIIESIQAELYDIAHKEPHPDEIMRAVKKTEMDLLAVKEDNQKLAYLIGKYFIALGDENYLNGYQQNCSQQVEGFVKQYLRPAVMHRGAVMPLREEEKGQWAVLQERSDEEDERILARITREAAVEDGAHVHTITCASPTPFMFPRASTHELKNGLKLFYHHNPQLPKIDLILDFKAKHYFDPVDKQGLSVFLSDMLLEGTVRYTAQQFAQELEGHGMTLNTFPGHLTMSMLKSDIAKGLHLLGELLMRPAFLSEQVEKVRTRLLSDVIDFWDNPSQFSGQLVREAVYKGHPYSRRLLGTADMMRSLTRDDIFAAYKRWITPQGSRLSVVGDIASIDVKQMLADALEPWSGASVADLNFPPLAPLTEPLSLQYPLVRDQIHLCFGGLSVARQNPDFDKLLLFDQVFTGGILGSMGSRLFALRERSGLFYTIGGSLLSGVGKQPGMLFIRTIVSPDRLAEAESQIRATIDEGARNLTHEELNDAKQVIINSLVDNFASNAQMATAFLFLDMFGLPADYFDQRAESLLHITREEVQAASARLLDSHTLVTLKVGRV